jgi:hypothetical protein
MKKIKFLVLPFLFSCFSNSALAAETPPVVQINSCSFSSGKDMNDLNSAVSFWQGQMEKLGGGNYFGALITPVISTLPDDFYWLGSSPNLNAWASGGAAYAASKEGQAATARLEKLGTCSTTLSYAEQVYAGVPPEPDDDNGFLEVFGCSLLKGKTMSNVRAVEANFNAAAKDAGAPMNVFRFTPTYSDGQVDLIYLVAHNDRAEFGKTNTMLATNPHTSAAFQNFASVMDCGSGLYDSRVIHRPTEAAAE